MAQEENNKLYSQQFGDAVLYAYTNLKAPLFDVVTKVKQTADRQLFDIVTGVGAGQDVARTKASDMNLSNDPFYRLKYSNVTSKRIANYLQNKAWATIVTDYDKERMFSDPQGVYIQAAVAHMRQKQQEVIWAGITGTVNIVTLDDNNTSVEKAVAQTNEVEPVIIDKIPDLLETLKAAKSSFDKKAVSEEDRFFICSTDVRNQLISNEKIGNSLYATMLGGYGQNGNIKNILGYNVVTYEAASTNDIFGYLVQKQAVKLAVNSEDLKAKVQTDIPGFVAAAEVKLLFSLGASRINNAGVIKVKKTA
jgi:hypothetical protein